VDEVDIGRVKVGQAATFTVDAFPDKTFNAVVEAIYPQAVIQDNVVNYAVVLGIQDAFEGLLRPQMTASVSITLDTTKGALVVPVRAIKHEGGKAFVQIPQGKGLVKMVGGDFVDLANDVLKSVDISHGVAPFLWKNGFLLIEDGIAFFRDLPLAVAADGMRGSKGGVLCLLHSHDAPAPGANDIDDQLSPPFSGTKKPPRESPLRAVVLIGSAIWFLS